MRFFIIISLLLSFLFYYGCSKHTQTEVIDKNKNIEAAADPVKKVISEDKRGIRTREDAIQFYINKGVSLYFDNNMNLTSFDCSRPGGLTDDDMKYLIFFPEAGAVHLSDKDITDEIFYYFQNLKKITTLSLYNTSVNGEGFIYLKDKTDLIIFDFGGSPITDKGLKYLSEINYADNIIILNLKGSKVTDEGMEYLKNMRIGKCRINLRHTTITDTGIKNLESFQNIVEVDLYYTKVTESGGRWLKNKLPGATVTWGEIPPAWEKK